MDTLRSAGPANRVQNILTAAGRRLTQAGCDTPGLDAEVLLAYALDQDRTWLYAHPQEIVGQEAADRFDRLLGRRERREPVAYITGCKAFFALDFRVNRHVLIPRPETELLVETAIEIANAKWPQAVPPQIKPDHQHSTFTIADVGTGSGCIVVALAKNLAQAALFAIDLSEEALRLARQNATRHGITGRVTFLSGNLLQPLASPVDMIVSNPPYVRPDELAAGSVSPEVSRYEPRLALDGGENGLQIIEQLLPQAQAKLNPGGTLLVEIGAAQGQAVSRLAQGHFPEAGIQIKRDLAGLDRLLVVETG